MTIRFNLKNFHKLHSNFSLIFLLIFLFWDKNQNNIFFCHFNIIILYLWHAKAKAYTRFKETLQGLRFADLESCFNAVFAEGLNPDVTLFSFHRKQYVRLRIVRRNATDHLWTLQSAYIEGAISCYMMQVARTIGSELLSKGVKTVLNRDAEKKWFA